MKRRLLHIIPVLMFLAICALAPFIIHNSIENQKNKHDLAEINHIRYGLFSINAWKEKMTDIVFEEVSKLDIKATGKDLKKAVESQLRALIDKVHDKIKESNSDSLGGKIKNVFIDAVVDMKEIKKGVPEYADTVIKEMAKPANEKQIKKMATKQIKTYFSKTYEDQDISLLNEVLVRAGTQDIDAAREKLDTETAYRKDLLEKQTFAIILLSILLFVWAGATQHSIPAPAFMLLLPTLLVLLVVGVTTPMIDMEAKITEMSFMLMGHPVKFENQVLYFQTKSVLDVFWIMITNKAVQMKIVGVLMVMFSVAFPLFKMFSSVVYYYDYRYARTNKFVKFFVLKSGKWSMTDVMIVAIFMAYIGFNGIISSQFGSLGSNQKEVVILTTNGTSLQPGFYSFLTYSVLALFLSGFLIRKPKVEPTLTDLLVAEPLPGEEGKTPPKV